MCYRDIVFRVTKMWRVYRNVGVCICAIDGVSITFKRGSSFCGRCCARIYTREVRSNSWTAAFRLARGRKPLDLISLDSLARGQDHKRGYWNSPVTPGQFPEGLAEWTTNMRFWISLSFRTTRNGAGKHRHEVLSSSDFSLPNMAQSVSVAHLERDLDYPRVR